MREANDKQIFFLVVVIDVVALLLPLVGAGVIHLHPLHECHVLKHFVQVGGGAKEDKCGSPSSVKSAAARLRDLQVHPPRLS